jgi:hypothetical protein
MGGVCSTLGGDAYCVPQNLVGKPEGEGPLERPKRRWEHTIKINLKEISHEGVDWVRILRIGTGGGLL